jgi:hypothetical protein
VNPIIATSNGKTFSQVLHHVRQNEFSKHFYLSTCNKNTPPDVLKVENDKPLNGELSLYLYENVLMCAVGEIAIFSRSPSIKYPFATCPNYKNAVIEIFKFLCVPPTLMSTPQQIAPYLISQSTVFPFSKSFLNFVSLYGDTVLNLVNGANCLPFKSDVKTFKFPTIDTKNEQKAVENGLKPPTLPTSPNVKTLPTSPQKNGLKPSNLPLQLPQSDTKNEQKQVEVESENVGSFDLNTMIETIYKNHKLSTDVKVKRVITKYKSPNLYIDYLFDLETAKNDKAIFSDFVFNLFKPMTV